MIVDNRIAEILDEKGMTYYRLAKKIGRKPHVIGRIISGKRGVSEKTIKDIADGLELPISEVFQLPGENNSKMFPKKGINS